MIRFQLDGLMRIKFCMNLRVTQLTTPIVFLHHFCSTKKSDLTNTWRNLRQVLLLFSGSLPILAESFASKALYFFPDVLKLHTSVVGWLIGLSPLPGCIRGKWSFSLGSPTTNRLILVVTTQLGTGDNPTIHHRKSTTISKQVASILKKQILPAAPLFSVQKSNPTKKIQANPSNSTKQTPRLNKPPRSTSGTSTFRGTNPSHGYWLGRLHQRGHGTFWERRSKKKMFGSVNHHWNHRNHWRSNLNMMSSEMKV